VSIHLVAAAILAFAPAMQTEHPPQINASTTQMAGPVNGAQGAQPVPAEERRVCRYVSSIGSNRRERICTTAAERREDRNLAREYQDRVNADRTLPDTSGFGGDSVKPAG